MAENKKPANTKTIIDVAHPGKSAPAENSKSVIVSNRPILQDPMMVVNGSESPNNKPAEDPLVKASDGPDLKPSAPSLPETEKPAETDKASKSTTIAELAENASKDEEPSPSDNSSAPSDEAKTDTDTVTDRPEKPEADADKQPEPDQPKAGEPETDKPETTETAGEDTETSPSKEEANKQLEAEATEQAKHQEAIDKLADSKKYYLPINTVEKRRSRRFVILGIVLSLLLVIAWADIALDAKLIQFGGIKPVTHFFSN